MNRRKAFRRSDGIIRSRILASPIPEPFESAAAPATPPQRLHQVDDVLAARPLLRGNRLGGPLLVDEVDQRGFVLVLELVRLEATGLLVHDVLGEIEKFGD
jgi:hypothetical protein